MKFKTLIIVFLLTTICFSQNVETYIYAAKGLDTLKLDVYSPENLNKHTKLPVVIWMHGGGFSGGSRDSFEEVSFMNYLTSKGYIGVSISYRLLRKGFKSGFGCNCPAQDKLFTFANAAEDFLDATLFITKNSESLNINANKIIASGSSAGAEAILSAVYMKEYYITETSKYDFIRYAGALSFAGAMVDVNYITEANAIPTVLFHGTNDKVVPFGKAPHQNCNEKSLGYLVLSGSEMISKRLDDLQMSYYFQKVEGGAHEVSGLPFNQLDRIFEFFDRTVLDSELIQTKKTVIKK